MRKKEIIDEKENYLLLDGVVEIVIDGKGVVQVLSGEVIGWGWGFVIWPKLMLSFCISLRKSWINIYAQDKLLYHKLKKTNTIKNKIHLITYLKKKIITPLTSHTSQTRKNSILQWNSKFTVKK